MASLDLTLHSWLEQRGGIDLGLLPSSTLRSGRRSQYESGFGGPGGFEPPLYLACFPWLASRSRPALAMKTP